MHVNHISTPYPEDIIPNYYTAHYKTLNIIWSGITYPSPLFIHCNDLLSHYNFEYIISGEGEIENNGIKHKVSAGDLIIVASNSLVSFRSNPDNPYKRLFFCPIGKNIDILCELYKIKTPIHIVKADVEADFMEIINSMKNNTYSEQLWNEVIFRIILKASALLSDVNVSVTLSMPEKIHQYIQNNIDTIIDLSDIAAALHTSKSNIMHSFKKHYGVSPYHAIIQNRMAKAQQLLQGTSLSIAEIATALNFSSTANFIKIYKKYSGLNLSPLQYRRAFLTGYYPVESSDNGDISKIPPGK